MHDERDTALAAIPTVQSRPLAMDSKSSAAQEICKPVCSNSGLRQSALPVPANGHLTIEDDIGDCVKYSTQRPFGHRRHLSAPTSPTHSVISRRPALRRPRSSIWPMPAETLRNAHCDNGTHAAGWSEFIHCVAASRDVLLSRRVDPSNLSAARCMASMHCCSAKAGFNSSAFVGSG